MTARGRFSIQTGATCQIRPLGINDGQTDAAVPAAAAAADRLHLQGAAKTHRHKMSKFF